MLIGCGVGEGTKTGCDPRAQGGQHPRGCQLWVLFGGSRDVGTQQRGGTSVLGEHWCTALPAPRSRRLLTAGPAEVNHPRNDFSLVG